MNWMSLVQGRSKRTIFYLSLVGLMIMVAAVSAISARDPSGVSLRVGMIMVTVGAGLWLPWRRLIPAVILVWLVPNFVRNLMVDDASLLGLNLALELLGLAGIGFFTAVAHWSLDHLEEEGDHLGSGKLAGINPETGVFNANQLRPALEAELARSRRFRRTFSLVLVDIDEMRQKFDYRDEILWKTSLGATTRMLRETRHNVDRVFHYKENSFAMILPEASEKDIVGLVKRLRRVGRSMKPPEGEPGGPIPVHFGATFYPECATGVEDLLMRAEVALRIAGSSTTRYQIDSAAAPELPPAETLRRAPAAVAPATPMAHAGAAEPLRAIGNPVAVAAIDETAPDRPQLHEQAQAPGESATAGLIVPAESVHLARMDSAGGASQATESAAGMGERPPETPVLQPSPAIAETPQPTASSAAPPDDARDGLDVAAEEPDDFEALLAQMDETLGMIRSARHDAA